MKRIELEFQMLKYAERKWFLTQNMVSSENIATDSPYSHKINIDNEKNKQKLLPTCFNQVAAINGDFSHQETSTINNWKR